MRGVGGGVGLFVGDIGGWGREGVGIDAVSLVFFLCFFFVFIKSRKTKTQNKKKR